MGAMFMAINRNKKCIALDYTTPTGLAALLPIAATANVIFADKSKGCEAWLRALSNASKKCTNASFYYYDYYYYYYYYYHAAAAAAAARV